MSNIIKHSITKKLLIVVFSIYLLVTITVTLLHMEFEYELSKKQTLQTLQNIQAMTEKSISQAIWEFNASQLNTILYGLLSNPYIVGIKLELPHNDLFPEMSSTSLGYIEDDIGELYYVNPNTMESIPIPNNFFNRLIPDEFVLTYSDAIGRDLDIGRMYLYSNNKTVFEMVKQSYILIILNAIIKTACLWIFILWAGYYFISKPLLKLTEAIKQLSKGDWKPELIYKSKDTETPTEINMLFDSFNDMTHSLKQTQDKLNYSRNRLNNIFDTTPSALAAVNNQQIIQGWNKYMCELTGVESKHAIDKPLTAVFPAFNEFIDMLTNAVAKNKPQDVQHVKITNVKDSAHRLFHISIYPIADISPPEAVIRIDDVTEQVKEENSLAQVEKLASVGASIAGVAHEINNPLAAIMQNTQNITRRLDANLPANQQIAKELDVDLNKQYKYLEHREVFSFLESIRIAGERASNIVKNMLKFTRRSTSDMSKHDIVEIINDSLQICASDIAIQEHIDFKEISINKNFDNQPILVDCYPMEIQQVIINLIRNATQAMNAEQQQKIINIDLLKPEENKILIKISDNGHGMNKDILAQIFQPFFTTKPVGKGTGLGLSVCRNIIVQKHHGNLEVNSELNKGTTFSVTLPIDQV